jgi:hypothetical protein
MFRIVFWDVLPCKIIVVQAVRSSETSVDNYFTRQYIPEDNSEHHTRRRENLKSHRVTIFSWPWLRRLVAVLSPRSPGFAPGLIHVGFMVDEVALGEVFLRVLLFFPVNIIPPSFSVLIYHPGDEQYVR